MATHAPGIDIAVCIGRFQPLHLGHVTLLRQALATARHCIVVIGSAFQARTPKHPWTWRERAEMIRLALPEVEPERLHVLPMRDYYDDALWTAATRRDVTALAQRVSGGAPARITLLGHARSRPPGHGSIGDAARGWAGWTTVPVDEPAAPIDAGALRDALFAAAPSQLDAALAALVDQAPRSTLHFIRASAALPHWPVLAGEWLALKRYHAEWAQSPYPPVFVTVDTVVSCLDHVLLIRRGQSPGKGLLAVPGGFIDLHETTFQSAIRELREETGLAWSDAALRECLTSVAVFDHPERSQRGRTITHAHAFELACDALPPVQAADDAQSADWIPIARLLSLEDQFHDDHFHMLDHFFRITTLGAHSTNLSPTDPPGHGIA